MELVRIKGDKNAPEEKNMSSVGRDEFIEANTTPMNFGDLRDNCIIPVFAKDNESTISHPEFIDALIEVANHHFSGQQVLSPSIRVSHPIKGRVPEAKGKPANQLLDHEKTIYYGRMAFIIDIPSIQESVNGNGLSLTVGGVRSCNQENLYNKKTEERFKVFIGFKNLVCTNLCVSTDGCKTEIKVRHTHELMEKINIYFRKINWR